MFYLFRRKVVSYGHNDIDEIPDASDLLLDYSRSAERIQDLRDKYQHTFYQRLWEYIVLTDEEQGILLNILGCSSDNYEWEEKLKKVSFGTFKKLESALKFDFLAIAEAIPQPDKFYPLIRHRTFAGFGLDTLNYSDLNHLVNCLPSGSNEEAFEKGVLFLILTNDISLNIGDPETTPYVADFKERYAGPRKKMLDYFSKSGFPFLKKTVPPELISKHQVLKFWILENPYYIDLEKFNKLLQFKQELLKDKLDHFEKIVALFREKKNELIEIINTP